MRAVVVRVECEDPSDADWLQARCGAAVEEVVAEQASRLDGRVEVSCEVDDGEQ